nr:immunoglobulin lambda-1 light chain-like [Nerophis lumbriciformis]
MLGILCLLIAALTGGDAAKVLTQTPAVLTVPGGREVVLDCNIQRDDDYEVSFYRQFPGDAPQLILRHRRSYSSPYYHSGFSYRQFGAKTSSSVDFQFIIKQAKAEYSAEYYCKTWDTSARETVSHVITVVFGGGTKLLVTSSDVTPPVVTVFPPSNDEVQSKQATLVCVAIQSTRYADVTWLARGLPATGTVATGPATRETNGNYKISSYLTVQTSEWNSDVPYTCKVSLGSLSAENTISKSNTSSPSHLKAVWRIYNSLMFSDTMLWILCLLIATLTRGDAAKVLTLTPADLAVPVGQKVVLYCPDATPPVVTVFPPSNDELQSKEVTLVCVATLSHLYATVTWQAGGCLATGTITTGPATREATGSYKISSYLTVQTSEWSSDIPYTCKVSSGLQSAQNTIKKSNCAT